MSRSDHLNLAVSFKARTDDAKHARVASATVENKRRKIQPSLTRREILFIKRPCVKHTAKFKRRYATQKQSLQNQSPVRLGSDEITCRTNRTNTARRIRPRDISSILHIHLQNSLFDDVHVDF